MRTLLELRQVRRFLAETAKCVRPTADSDISQNKRMPNNIFNARAEANVPQVCLAFRSQQHAAVPQEHDRVFFVWMTARMDDMCECDESCGIHGAVIRQRVALEMHACICQKKTIRVFPNCSHADCATTPRHVPKSMFQNRSRDVYTEIVHSTQYQSWRLRASGLPVMSQPPLF